MNPPTDSNIRTITDTQFHSTFLRDAFVRNELVFIVFGVMEEVH